MVDVSRPVDDQGDGRARCEGGGPAEYYRRHLPLQLRDGALADLAVAAGKVALQDCARRREFQVEIVPPQQGRRESTSAIADCTIHWSLVELDGHGYTERVVGSVGPDVVRGFRGAAQAQLRRVLRGLLHGEPIYTEALDADGCRAGDL